MKKVLPFFALLVAWLVFQFAREYFQVYQIRPASEIDAKKKG